MPVALQVIGRRGEEMTVLRVARALERIMPWADKRPKLPATE
jgi:amidase